MANGTGLNGYVAVPRWVLGLATGVVLAMAGWAVQDRRQIGMEMARLREDMAAIRDTRFREADGLRMERELRGYVDMRIREYHGGAP